jgi:nucleoside-diphosphate-sugar epimerase
MKILLTGATGFVGKVLLKKLIEAEYRTSIVCRNLSEPSTFVEQLLVESIDGKTDWSSKLVGSNIVIHCAARVHMMNEDSKDVLSSFRSVNTAGTLNLARHAAEVGAKRFIYISSIKVNGESTTGSLPFTERDIPNPLDPYGVSKYEAEEGLKKIAGETGMSVVIIRPPLVYGSGVKANFLNLLKLSNTKLPLPFGLVNNKRSMVYVENLADFIVNCIEHPAAANQTFFVSDNHDLSLRNLLVLMRNSMHQRSRLVPIPVCLFNLAGFLFRKKGVADRLIGNLQINPSKAMTLLDWKPPYTVEQGVQATVDSFLKDNIKVEK